MCSPMGSQWLRSTPTGADAATRHDRGEALVIEGVFDVALPLLRDAWTRTLPDALGA
jgi:hypothetical protein